MLPMGGYLVEAIRQDREREAAQAMLIARCNLPDPYLKRLLRLVGFKLGLMLQITGKRLRAAAGCHAQTYTREYIPGEVKYG